jgi:4-amino-4-deoxy-L-arabinose transferase-like glycosyltransferase
MKKLFWGVIVLLAVQSFLLISTARQKALVYDEPIYPTAGVIYWKTGDLSWNKIHPPLQKYLTALPLLATRADVPPLNDSKRTDEWRTAYRFFFQNTEPAQKIIFLSRLPSILLTLLLALAVFLWTRKRAGAAAGLFAMTLVAFDPMVNGVGSLALNDIYVTIFSFLAVAIFLEVGGIAGALLCGLFAGCAFASKFSAIVLLPILFTLHISARENKPKRPAYLGTALLVAGAVTLAIYGFKVQLLLDAINTLRALSRGDSNIGFLLVPLRGWKQSLYYPVGMLIKTPIPILTLWAMTFWLLLRDKIGRGQLYLLTPVIGFLAFVLFTHNHYGVRYLLPIIPFLAVWTGVIYSLLTNQKEKYVFIALLAWTVAETAWAHPHHLAYFNELIGGSKNGYKWMDASNQDWGQDISTLGRYVDNYRRERNNAPATVLIGYSGINNPEAWGLAYQDVFSPAVVNSFRADAPQPIDAPYELLAVSAWLRHNPFYAWLDQKKPEAFLGNTIFVYDISNDVESTLEIGQIYLLMERLELAKRQLARARRIDPANPVIPEFERLIASHISRTKTAASKRP